MKNTIVINFIFALFFISFLQAEEDEVHLFEGRHLVASYTGCDSQALTNLEALEQAFHEAVIASGATVLSTSKYVFAPDGLTMVILLSESHASIHTYPEYQSCFVDLFTCGPNCDSSKFAASLEKYLKPTEVDQRLILRNSSASHHKP